MLWCVVCCGMTWYDMGWRDAAMMWCALTRCGVSCCDVSHGVVVLCGGVCNMMVCRDGICNIVRW